MQPYFFPYIGYFQLIAAADKFVFYDDVNYIKRGWVSRNRINIHGKPSYFGVQTSKASQFSKIRDIKLNSDYKWRKKLLKSLELNYKKSINFDKVYDIVKNVVMFETNNLSEMNKKSIVHFCKYLGIDTEIVDSSVIFDNSELHGQERILDICVQCNASVYINAINGKELYSVNDFDNKNISLKFIEMNRSAIDYDNIYLSIIDLVMNTSMSDLSEMLNCYTLV